MSAFLKNRLVKVLGGFVYLSEATDPPPPYTRYEYSTYPRTYSHKEVGGGG
jgi:hypothetical protein